MYRRLPDALAKAVNTLNLVYVVPNLPDKFSSASHQIFNLRSHFYISTDVGHRALFGLRDLVVVIGGLLVLVRFFVRRRPCGEGGARFFQTFRHESYGLTLRVLYSSIPRIDQHGCILLLIIANDVPQCECQHKRPGCIK